MPDSKEKGLYAKYRVERTDGKPVGEGIFLEFADSIAWGAIETWARNMNAHGYRKAAEDTLTKLRDYIKNDLYA